MCFGKVTFLWSDGFLCASEDFGSRLLCLMYHLGSVVNCGWDVGVCSGGQDSSDELPVLFAGS